MGCASSKEDAGDGGAGHQLWNACKAGDINAIERLVAEGAKPNTYKDKVRWWRACCNSGCGRVCVVSVGPRRSLSLVACKRLQVYVATFVGGARVKCDGCERASH